MLRHFEGLSIDEIGEALGTGTNATKHSIFRAVQKLRRSLEPVVGTAQMNHLSEEQLVLFYYGESAEASGIEEHLAGCEQCRGRFPRLATGVEHGGFGAGSRARRRVWRSRMAAYRRAAWRAQAQARFSPGGSGRLRRQCWCWRLFWQDVSRIAPKLPQTAANRTVSRCASASCWWPSAITWSGRKWCWPN